MNRQKDGLRLCNSLRPDVKEIRTSAGVRLFAAPIIACLTGRQGAHESADKPFRTMPMPTEGRRLGLELER